MDQSRKYEGEFALLVGAHHFKMRQRLSSLTIQVQVQLWIIQDGQQMLMMQGDIEACTTLSKKE